MKLNISNTAKTILTVGAVIVTLFGISLATILKQSKAVWKCPERLTQLEERYEKKIRQQDSIILILLRDSYENEDAHQMYFHTLRWLTDNYGQESYYIFYDGSTKQAEVDIRTTNEDFMLGFIYDLWIPYPVSQDYGEVDRITLKLHDYTQGKTKDTRIYRGEVDHN